VISTGLIAIPVLSGSLSYIFAESFGWEEGLDKKFHEAKGFYAIIIVSLIVGLGLNFIGISPVKALIYTAVLYGISAPVLIGIILHIANNKTIMGEYTNGFWANLVIIFSILLKFLKRVLNNANFSQIQYCSFLLFVFWTNSSFPTIQCSDL
jgi:Mn2+/Fe2+ NRAMP family transporter